MSSRKLPSAAVRVSDWLSLGAGPAFTYGMLDWKLQGPFGGQIWLKDLDDWQVSAYAGLLLQPLEVTPGVGADDQHAQGLPQLGGAPHGGVRLPPGNEVPPQIEALAEKLLAVVQ